MTAGEDSGDTASGATGGEPARPSGGPAPASGVAGAAAAPVPIGVVAFLVAAVTAAVFSPAVRDTLLAWDDAGNLELNRRWVWNGWETVSWAFTTFHFGPWQPLSWLSYSLDGLLWGGDVRGFYVTNVVLQAATAGLLTLVAARLLPIVVPGILARPRVVAGLAAAAGVLWGCHPLRVESVAWATERRDVLSGFFLVASFLAWLRHVAPDGTTGTPDAPAPRSRGAYAASLLLFVLSLLAKGTAMGWGLALLLLDVGPLGRPFLRALPGKVPFLLAGVGAAVLGWKGQEVVGATIPVDQVPFAARVLVAGFATAQYAARTFVPVGLRAHYARPEIPEILSSPPILLGTVVTIVVLTSAVFLFRRRPWSASAVGAWCVLLGPVSGLSLTGSHLVADRYSHQPGLVLSLAVVCAVGALLVGSAPVGSAPNPRRRFAVAGLVAVLPVFAVQAALLTATWRDPAVLWSRVARFEPKNWVAHEQLALVASKENDWARARDHLEISLASKRDRIAGTVFLAYAYVNTGDPDAAERTLDSFGEHLLKDPPAWRVRGLVAQRRGDVEGAIAAFREATRLQPTYVEAHQSLGEALARAGRFREAVPALRELIALTPADPAPRALLGTVLGEAGDPVAAEKELRDAIALSPTARLPRVCLGDLLVTTGRVPAGEEIFRTLLAESPDDAEVLTKLAILAAQRGDAAAAAEFQVRAADALPGNAEARVRAALLLERAGRPAEALAAARAALALASAANDGQSARLAQSVLTRLGDAPK